MEFKYKGKDYMLSELKEPNSDESLDIIAIFRIRTYLYNGFERIKEISLEEAKENENQYYNQGLRTFSKYEFINYYYGADEDSEDLKEYAINYINRKKD